MDTIFNSVKLEKPARNLHDCSFDNKMTLNMGELVPFCVQECYPGEEYEFGAEIFARFLPLIAPVMHRVDVYLHYFFVPLRLLHERAAWDAFLSSGADGKTPVIPSLTSMRTLAYMQGFASRKEVFGSDPTLPETISGSSSPYHVLNGTSQIPVGSLSDYLGFPTTGPFTGSTSIARYPAGDYGLELVSLLPFKCYQFIYNEYYRDENLIPEVGLHLETGVVTSVIFENDTSWADLFTLRHRAWHKDYFTASLPWTQRGNQVLLPLGTQAPIRGDINAVITPTATSGSTLGFATYPITFGQVTTEDEGALLDPGTLTQNAKFYLSPNSLYADLSYAAAATINDLRGAFAVQHFLERNSICGVRYNEQILAHFGVQTPDARLQRPEFIGGFRQMMTVEQVQQTAPFGHYNSEKDEYSFESVPAQLAGNAYVYGNDEYNRYYCVEHGFLMGIVSVMPHAAYFQGIPRKYLRHSNLDYYWPEFAHLGEQATLQCEIYTPMCSTYYGDVQSGYVQFQAHETPDYTPETTFGYMPRYSELRCNQDEIHGDFRDTLLYWHIARKFDKEPALNQEFIETSQIRDGLSRIFALEQEVNEFYSCKTVLLQINLQLHGLKPLPVYAQPML